MTEAIAFDTHRFVKNLTASGFTEEQAEALASEQVQLLNSNLATKADVLAVKVGIEKVRSDLELKIEKVKSDLLKWMVMAMIAQGGLIVSLVKAL